MGANGESTSGTASSAKKLEHYLALGSALDSSAAAVDLIGAATAEPGLLAFQELLPLSTGATPLVSDPGCWA